MATLTLELPDELLQQLQALGDKLPEWLALSLTQPALPARLYRDILSFLASQPTPEQIINYKADPVIQERLETLLARNKAGNLSPAEAAELDEYEHIEHFIIMLKTGFLQHSSPS